MTSIEFAVREHRDALVGLAYRMLGTVTDAQDAVQEAFLRLEQIGLADIDNVGGWLNRTTSRICLDRLTTAQARREVCVGPWLPEPLATDADPTDPVELAESVAMHAAPGSNPTRPHGPRSPAGSSTPAVPAMSRRCCTPSPRMSC